MTQIKYLKTKEGKRLQVHTTFLYISDKEGQSQAYIFRIDYYTQKSNGAYICSGSLQNLKTHGKYTSHVYDIHNPIWPKSKQLLSYDNLPPHLHFDYHNAKQTTSRIKE